MDTCMHSADLEQKLIKRVLLTATDNPMLQIAVRDDSKAGASPANPSGTSTLTTAPYKTIQIAAAGSSGGNVIVYLNIGASSASYKQYQFSYSGVAVADPDSVATGANIIATATTTLGALVAALRSVPLMDGRPGNTVEAYRLNAPAGFALNTALMTALAKTDLPGMAYPLKTMYRSTACLTASGRVGFPQDMDSAKLNLISCDAVATFVGTATVSLYYADVDDVNDVSVKFISSALASTTSKTLFDWSVRPQVYRGPILITLVGDTSFTNTAVEVILRYSNAQI